MSIKEILTRILGVIKSLIDRDYIVDEGKSGEWTYRKWNSGIAECWRVATMESTSLSWSSYMASPTANPYLYYSSGCSFNLPFAFTDNKYALNATMIGVGPNFGWIARGSKTDSSFVLYIVRNGNSGTLTYDISVKGWWK